MAEVPTVRITWSLEGQSYGCWEGECEQVQLVPDSSAWFDWLYE